MITYVLAAAAFLTLLASLVYIRSARLRFRVVRLIDADVNRDVEAHSLAFSAYRKEPTRRSSMACSPPCWVRRLSSTTPM